MATPYEDIYGRFAMKVTDYNLDKLYLNDQSEYVSYINGFLVSSISKFYQCNKDLQQRDDTLRQFQFNLEDLEIEILSSMMVVEWCSKEVHNIMELRGLIQDSEFKTFSESQRLKEKKDLLSTTREYVDKLIVSYSYLNLDFSTL